MKKYKIFLSIFILILLAISIIPIKAKTNNLVVGLEVDYAPFNYASNNKSKNPHKLNVSNESAIYASGYDIFIAKEIGKKLGKILLLKNLIGIH